MILFHLFLGFVTSYVGFFAPSMLNVTASKIYVENDVKIARFYVLGVSVVVLLQVLIAIKITEVIKEYPQIIYQIKNVAIAVFAMLSMLFVYKGFSKSKQYQPKPIKNGFVVGLTLSTINMFAIPFFVLTYSFFIMNGWVVPGVANALLFGLGTGLGVFTVLSNYVYLAKKVQAKITSFTKYFNFIIGTITGLVALYSFIKLYF